MTELFYYSSNIEYTDEMFDQMWLFDKNLFIRIIFYLRQHRCINMAPNKPNTSFTEIAPTLKQTLRKVVGRGIRKIFHQVLRWMSYHHLPDLLKLLPYIPDYGYWKDLLVLLGTPVEDWVIKLFATQLNLDYQNFNQPVPGLISMAAKWTPNEGSSYDKHHNIFGKIAREMGVSRKFLRKYYLVPLRRYLSVTEQIITDKRWNAINYDAVPRRSLKANSKIFVRHDSERFNEYTNQSSTDYTRKLLLPIFVNSMLKVLSYPMGVISSNQQDRITKENDGTIYAIDIAGSMTGFPIILGACMCIESGNQTWIPFQFEGNNYLSEPLSISGRNYLDQVNGIINQQYNNNGSNIQICINLARSINKRHLLIISNTLLDASEIPLLDQNLHLTYWSINPNPVKIYDYPHCTIIEGYDLNVYFELRDGNILNRTLFQNIILETVRQNDYLPII